MLACIYIHIHGDMYAYIYIYISDVEGYKMPPFALAASIKGSDGSGKHQGLPRRSDLVPPCCWRIYNTHDVFILLLAYL